MEETVINLSNKQEYVISAIKNGENVQVCPVCSSDRKKSKIKCFSYNAEKEVGKCNHCGVTLVKKKEFVKESKIEYIKPIWKNNTKISDKAVLWFKNRLISQSTIEAMKVYETEEFMPQSGKIEKVIAFPYFRDGVLINIKYRTY